MSSRPYRWLVEVQLVWAPPGSSSTRLPLPLMGRQWSPRRTRCWGSRSLTSPLSSRYRMSWLNSGESSHSSSMTLKKARGTTLGRRPQRSTTRSYRSISSSTNRLSSFSRELLVSSSTLTTMWQSEEILKASRRGRVLIWNLMCSLIGSASIWCLF